MYSLLLIFHSLFTLVYSVLTFTFMPYFLMQVHVVIDPYPVPAPNNFQILCTNGKLSQVLPCTHVRNTYTSTIEYSYGLCVCTIVHSQSILACDVCIHVHTCLLVALAISMNVMSSCIPKTILLRPFIRAHKHMIA